MQADKPPSCTGQLLAPRIKALLFGHQPLVLLWALMRSTFLAVQLQGLKHLGSLRPRQVQAWFGVLQLPSQPPLGSARLCVLPV